MDDVVRTEKLISRKNGPVGEIIFNNPAKRNAVSLDMWQRLGEVLAEFEQDTDIRVLVLSGAGGKAFVSGADISKFESERATKEAVKAYDVVSKSASSRLYNFPRPTIAKIEGFCVGGGVGIAVGCDMRFCGERSRFSIPAAKLGVGYGFAGVKRLADIVGTSRAMEIFYTARQFTAAEAYEMGLVNRVLPETMLDAYVEDYTQMIAENAPLTIATIKAVSRAITTPSAERDLGKLEKMVADCFASNDYVEGRRAFMEKRKPNFTGT